MVYATNTYPQSASAADRVDWVDTAKGICIILVVMMHTTLGLEEASGQRGWMHAVVEFARPFRMPDFFMISGLFLVATIDRPWRLYLDRKVVHFFYFYILWVIIQFGFKAPFMITDGASVTAVAKTFLFTFVQPFGTLWFIYMLPVFFVITKLFKSYKWWLFGFAALIQMAQIETTHLYEPFAQSIGIVFTQGYFVLVDEFARFFVFFLGGYLFAPFIFQLAKMAREQVSSAMVIIGCWFVINLVLVVMGVAALPVISLLLGAAGAIAIALAASLITRLSITSPLTWLGAHSIVIYLAFFLPMVVMRLLLLKFVPDMDPGTMALTSIVVAVISPAIGYWIIGRIGFGRFLFHRPQWAVLAEPPVSTRAQLQPAE